MIKSNILDLQSSFFKIVAFESIFRNDYNFIEKFSIRYLTSSIECTDIIYISDKWYSIEKFSDLNRRSESSKTEDILILKRAVGNNSLVVKMIFKNSSLGTLLEFSINNNIVKTISNIKTGDLYLFIREMLGEQTNILKMIA